MLLSLHITVYITTEFILLLNQIITAMTKAPKTTRLSSKVSCKVSCKVSSNIQIYRNDKGAKDNAIVHRTASWLLCQDCAAS